MNLRPHNFAEPKKKVPMKPMEVVESVRSSGEGDVKMTAFVNFGNEEEQMMVVNEEAMKEADGEMFMKAKMKKKVSKKDKLVAMAMARLKKMELGIADEEGGGTRMADMMRLVALEPQIIGPVVEVGYSSSSLALSLPMSSSSPS